MDVNTGGGASVGGNVDTDSGGFVGRDKKDFEINNNIFPTRTGSQPPTMAHQIIEILDKLDMLIRRIDGDPENDIIGVRPRLRHVERELVIQRYLVAVLIVATVALQIWH